MMLKEEIPEQPIDGGIVGSVMPDEAPLYTSTKDEPLSNGMPVQLLDNPDTTVLYTPQTIVAQRVINEPDGTQVVPLPSNPLPEPEDAIPTAIPKAKKIKLIDSITNFVYNLIYRKNG